MNTKSYEILENKLISLNLQAERLSIGLEETKEVSGKQLTLLELLNKKFPNIEQFSKALVDVKELYDNIENLNQITEDIRNELFMIENILQTDKNEQNEKEELKNSIITLLHEVNKIEDISLIQEEINILLLKIGK